MGGKLQDNILKPGKTLYSQKAYEDALAFFLSLPSDQVVDKIEVAYYLGLCYAKLQKYDDAVSEMNGILEREIFIYAFRLGDRFAIETLSKDE